MIISVRMKISGRIRQQKYGFVWQTCRFYEFHFTLTFFLLIPLYIKSALDSKCTGIHPKLTIDILEYKNELDGNNERNGAFLQTFVWRNDISNAQGKKWWTKVRSHHFFPRAVEISYCSFSTPISKKFLFLPFLSKPLLKSAFRSLKWGFLFLIWNLVLYFLILKCYYFCIISALFLSYFCDFRGLEIGFPAFKMALRKSI